MQDPDAYRIRRTMRILVLLAVVLRVGSAIYQGDSVETLPGVSDQISYHELSLRVLEGHGFSFEKGWWPATPAGQPTAHWSFLYVLYLCGVYSLFGINPLAARLIQAALTGLLQPLLAWRIGRRLFGVRVGLVSAAVASVYAYFVFYSGALMTESFYILAILWTIDLATAMAACSDFRSHAIRMLSWIQLGTALAIAVLFRQVFLLLVPVILLWLSWELAGRVGVLSIRQVLGRCALVLITLALCIAPWTIRNYRVFRIFVLLNTNSGFAFFWGNHPIHGTRFNPLLPPDTYAALIPPELRDQNEADMDRELLKRGFAFVRADPVRYLLLSISRSIEYFKCWPSTASSATSNLSRILSSGLYLPLVLCGGLYLLFRTHHSRDTDDPSLRPKVPGTSLLVLVGLIYTLLHLMSWTLIRYRLPVDAVGIPIAALAVVGGYDRLREAVLTLILNTRRSVG